MSADVRFALRSFARRPGFVAAVVGTLGLGIGANTAVFTLVDAVILNPVAVGHPNDLVAIYTAATGTPYGSNAFAGYRAIVSRNASFTGVAAYTQTTLTLTEGGTARDVGVALATDNYFPVLEVSAAMGRTFLPSDPTAAGSNPVVVLSDAFWRANLGADPSIVGRRLSLGGQSFTVIGVTPPRFRGTSLAAVPDAWIPLSMVSTLHLGLLSRSGALDENSGVKLFSIVARLAPGVGHDRATANVTAIAKQSTSAGPPQAMTLVPISHAAAAVRDPESLVRFVRLLFGVVGLTLVLACLNVANLLVVRAGERATELGVRTALGASALRLTRQLLTESVALALAGGALGLAVAVLVLRLLSTFTLPGGIALDRVELGLDPRVLAFTSLLSLATALAFGLAPAIQATRANVIDVLRHHDGGRPRLAGRGVLLAAQVAISLTLLVGAGLFLRSLRAGLTTDLGFDPRPLAAVSTPPQLGGQWSEKLSQYLDIVARVRQMPGITAAAASSHVPLSGLRPLPFAAGAASPSPAPGRNTVLLTMASVTEDYFDVLGVPLMSGRRFAVSDGPLASRVVILNETAARSFWPGESPLGKQINFFDDRTYTVVGVVRDIKYATLQDRGVPFAYAPLMQEEVRGPVSFVARSTQPRAAVGMLQAGVAGGAPGLTAVRPRLVTDQIDAVLMPQRFGATLLSVFALVALGISAVGIHGTVAYAVSRRTTEIGIRTALGAQRSDVLRLVLTESGVAALAGVVLGVIGAALTTRFVAHFLYEITASDWRSFAGAVAAVIVVTIAAVLVPASRAVRVDPVKAMRTSQ